MKLHRLWALLLALVLSAGLMAPVSAAADVTDVLNDTAVYLLKTVPQPQVGSIGGEWAVLGLARSGYSVSQSYFENYYQAVEDYVAACGGVLHKRKYTEYSRLILALTAIGKDPTSVAKYDLLAPLGDFDQTVWQGVNGPIFALIALDSGSYASDLRQAYVDYILDQEISGGGWSLKGDEPDADMTAMALQALAKYQDQPAVKAATDRALTWLSESQNSDGGFSSYDLANCESCAQVVVALCELGIPLDDSRFVKGGSTPLDAMMRYYSTGNGFTHVLDDDNGVDAMSTEQGFYALVAAHRAAKGQSSLYRMSQRATASFPDVAGHENQTAIDALVAKEIINGMGDGTFSPDKTMTRAQFCTIVVKALALKPQTTGAFSDVSAEDWFAGYVGAASEAGIVAGVGGGKFAPNGTITRQEAAVMVARAARVLGLDTAAADVDSALRPFTDGGETADWARAAVAYCCESGILTASGALRPTQAIQRGEIAQMVYELLGAAGKL